MSVLQVALAGVGIGFVYALLAAGLNLVFGVFEVLNIAHGQFLYGGAIVTYLLWSVTGINPLWTIPISAAAMFMAGAAVQVALVEKVLKHGLITALLLLFGVAVLGQGIGLATMGVGERSVRFGAGSLQLAEGLRVSNVRLIAIAVCVPLFILMHLYLTRTRLGVATKATAQNPEIAQSCGIDVRKIRTITMGISCALAGVAGSLIILMFPLTPQSTLPFAITAFLVAVVGGMGSFKGSIIAGVLYGVGEGLAAYATDSRTAVALGFALLIVVLLVRPGGIAGVEAAARA